MLSQLARYLVAASGSVYACVLAILLVLAWAALGLAYFGFGYEYQQIIGSITAIVTYILAFFILHAQNRDTKAMQAKLDEIIACTSGARDSLIQVEDTNEKVIDAERKDPSRPPGDDYGNDS